MVSMVSKRAANNARVLCTLLRLSLVLHDYIYIYTLSTRVYRTCKIFENILTETYGINDTCTLLSMLVIIATLFIQCVYINIRILLLDKNL